MTIHEHVMPLNAQCWGIICTPYTASSIYSISNTNFPNLWWNFRLPITPWGNSSLQNFLCIVSLLGSIGLKSNEWFCCMSRAFVLRHAQEGFIMPAKVSLYLLLFWNFLKLLHTSPDKLKWSQKIFYNIHVNIVWIF
jgi:hypothetical protein